jgi:hypothetical protein
MGPGEDTVTDEEAYEFYKDPEHLRVVGPGYRRKADRLTEVKSVRFSPRMLAAAQAAAEADDRDLGQWIRMLVSNEIIRQRRALRERPAGLIPGSGRRGEPKSLPSAPRSGAVGGPGRTFACEHMSIGNVEAASCGICGPLAAVS